MRGRALWAAKFAARHPNVAVIDLSTLSVVGEITGLSNPDGMAWAERPVPRWTTTSMRLATR